MDATASSTRSWRIVSALAAIALLAGCGLREPGVSIRSAAVDLGANPVLAVDLDLALSPPMREALERGIDLTLAFELSPRDATQAPVRRHLLLRYAPLSARYQLVDVERGNARSFARRTQLAAALDRVRLPLRADQLPADAPAGWELTVRVDAETLPGVLRLPALVSGNWRLAAHRYAWAAAT